ncbi:LemA family protein [Halorhodospira abdelmalekii]|uniref:LemA family protein n=1 Tax=Halorhodospira abdelmalekii TaxID=421629 RepID=UPI0019088499|nr:LemA family protein [Halorhodospira abdelmalekii]MBK1735714.1 LemA family protein [Halorhodospira abdelmalekii]
MELLPVALIIGLLLIMVIYSVSIYNKLVSYRTQYENAFAQIDVQLKRRLDLIPNLVEVARKYMEHEKETLLAVTRARSEMATALEEAQRAPGNADVMKKLAAAEGTLQSAMAGFNLRVEAYPDLKASENMKQLSEELVSTENRVAYARQGYNDLVQKYNEYRRSFPPVLFASMFGHPEDATLLEFAESRETLNEAPQVNF